MAATRLPGYRRKKGLARRYETPEGAEISYREYRARLEQQGAVKRLEAAQLAASRRRQREFNSIVRQMAKIRAQALDTAIEATESALERVEAQYGEGLIDDDEYEALVEEISDRLKIERASRRTVKREAIRSPTRKEAIRDLESAAAGRYTDKRGVRHYATPADELKARQALTALGRREGIPAYVPVGMSDKKRSWGRFRRADNRGRMAAE